ncbi:uncharacterized protein LOC126919493 [Bombus affinis]|uniref:uncharacterized protein LOC126919493 n=1 Tax=Bombus affinis TaxID=309941 RepID=UPI0021B7860D|nr:uncharacterized protein LOC126919493 [Bombus affinis]
MFFPSFSSTHIKYKNISKTISNEWNIKDLEDYENICKNSHQNNKDICFSDTDLKFLVIPLSPTKSDIQNDELLLCKWNSGNINNSKKQNNTNHCKHLYRSTNSYTSSTLSNRSNAIKIGIDQILQVNSKIKNCSIYNSVKINTVNRDNLKELKSQINLNEHNGYLKKKEKRMKSSIDILRYEIKEAREKILKTDKNFIGTSLMKNNCKNSIIEQTILEQLICNNHICISSDNTSEISETYDELGILFSQYIKLQTQLCQRKYCPLKRYLKHKVQHTTRKCQTKFNYSRIYPYDQRPTCNNGNICIDTYDELKLMCTTPTRRKDIYRCMFKRRKHILNQPCIISNQNFATVE